MNGNAKTHREICEKETDDLLSRQKYEETRNRTGGGDIAKKSWWNEGMESDAKWLDISQKKVALGGNLAAGREGLGGSPCQEEIEKLKVV